MRKCVICGKVNGPGSFFKVPTDERKLAQWSEKCRVELNSTAKVCSDHFLPNDFIVGSRRIKLMPNAIPSIGLGFKGSYCPGAGDGFPFSKESLNAMHFNDISGRTDCNNLPEEDIKNIDTEENTKYWYEVLEEIPNTNEELKVPLVNVCTQTDNDVIISHSEMENYNLRNKMKKLKAENANLRKELEEARNVVNSMKNIFTDGQLRKMANPEKNIKWRWEDIASCMRLHTSGPRAYSHLYQKGFPLPDVSTLQRWARKIKVKKAKQRIMGFNKLVKIKL